MPSDLGNGAVSAAIQAPGVKKFQSSGSRPAKNDTKSDLNLRRFLWFYLVMNMEEV